MGFDRLSAEHSTQALQQLMEELGITGVAPTDAAQAQTALTTLGANVFHTGQSFNVTPSVGGGRAAFEAGQEPELPESAKDRFVSIANRAVDGGAVTAQEMFLLEAMMHQYDPNQSFVVDGEINADERLTILGFLEDPNASISGVHSNITNLFNARAEEEAIAALEAAERAELELTRAQPTLEVQAQMAAAGLIDSSEITGEWTDAHIDALIDATFNDPNAYFTMVPALGANMTEVTRNMFVNPPEDYSLNPEGASAVLDFLNEGRDITSVIETALETNDPDQIRMVQGMTGQRITGEWDPASLSAAEERLGAPQEGGFPDHLYSASRGEVATADVAEALRNGDMIMPSEEQLENIAPELSFMAAEDRVATWLSDPSNHGAYAEMVVTQAISAETRALLDTRMEEAEVAVEQAETMGEVVEMGVDAMGEVQDLPSVEVDTTVLHTTAVEMETARLEGDVEAFEAAGNEYVIEAEAVLLEAEMGFVRNHAGAFESAAYWLRDDNPELSELLASGDEEAIREFLTSHETTELQQIFYNSNTALGASFGTNATGSGWQDVLNARADLAAIRQELGIDAPVEGEVAPIEVEAVPVEELVSDARTIIDQGGPLTGSELEIDLESGGNLIVASFDGARNPVEPEGPNGGSYVVDQGMGIAARQFTV